MKIILSFLATAALLVGSLNTQAGPTGHVEVSTNPEVGRYLKDIPASVASVARMLDGAVEDGDRVTAIRKGPSDRVTTWTTTVSSLRHAIEDGTFGTGDPAPGDEVTFTQARWFSDQLWRISYTYTWMLNVETNQHEWMQTAVSANFVQFRNTQEQ